jgi:hypothetical protein
LTADQPKSNPATWAIWDHTAEVQALLHASYAGLVASLVDLFLPGRPTTADHKYRQNNCKDDQFQIGRHAGSPKMGWHQVLRKSPRSLSMSTVTLHAARQASNC